MEQPSQVVCSICKNGTHNVSACPELCDPLNPGFYSGGGGGGGHSHEEDNSNTLLLFHNSLNKSP